MRIHIPALPGQPTVRGNGCPHTTKLVTFAKVMLAIGHEVILYGGGASDAPVAEFVDVYGDVEPLAFDEPDEWLEPNLMAAVAITKRAEPGDYLGISLGTDQ
jgi:hypothetical protein